MDDHLFLVAIPLAGAKFLFRQKQIRKQQNLFSQFCDGCPKEKKKPTNIIYKRRQKEENKYKYTSQCYSLYYGGV
jgi:hypothetical protein